MAFDIEMIKSLYSKMGSRIEAARKVVGRPLTLSEKILYLPSLGRRCKDNI
jgi:aconitate hydratase